MLIYRKKRGSDTWHWCKNCSKWPIVDYEESKDPKSGELCNECRSKDKEGECKK